MRREWAAIEKYFSHILPNIHPDADPEWSDWMMDAHSSLQCYLKCPSGTAWDPVGMGATVGYKVYFGGPAKGLFLPRCGTNIQISDKGHPMSAWGAWAGLPGSGPGGMLDLFRDSPEILERICADVVTMTCAACARINRKRQRHGLAPLYSVGVEK